MCDDNPQSILNRMSREGATDAEVEDMRIRLINEGILPAAANDSTSTQEKKHA